MLTAIFGIVGVGIGALLTAALAVSREGRAQRLDALTRFVAANARLTVAHEGLFELVSTGVPPEITSEPARSALQERANAMTEWRAAFGRVLLLVPIGDEFEEAVSRFRAGRAQSTAWVREYQRAGASFEFSPFAAKEKEAWRAMRLASDDVISAARLIVVNDLRLFSAVRRRAEPLARRG
jgi:hypothetical protein